MAEDGRGFTPATALHQRALLRRVVRSWGRHGFEPAEALQWHRRSFSAAHAARWRAQGVDLSSPRVRRGGYVRGRERPVQGRERPVPQVRPDPPTRSAHSHA